MVIFRIVTILVSQFLISTFASDASTASAINDGNENGFETSATPEFSQDVQGSEIEMKSCCRYQDTFHGATCGLPSNGLRPQPFPIHPQLKVRHNLFKSNYPLWCQGVRPVKKWLKIDLDAGAYEVYGYGDGNININNTVYPLDQYCVDSMGVENGGGGKVTLGIYTCTSNCSDTNPCFKKCCDWDESFKNSSFECSPDPTPVFNVSAFNKFKKDDNTVGTRGSIKYVVNNGLSCVLKLSELKFVRVSDSGAVKIQYDLSSWVEVKEYCLEVLEGKHIAAYCDSELYQKTKAHNLLQMIYCIISWNFILLTLIIYFLVWKKHGITGWTQFAFILSTFFYFFMRFVRRWYDLAHISTSSTSLVIYRIDTFFTFGLFTNLINLSFQMFWTFWKISPETTKNLRSLRRLFISLFICWTFSATMVITELFIKPEIIQTVQKYTVISLLVLNTIIVMGTAGIIGIRLNRRSEISSSFDMAMMVKLYIKLFCFTGMVWSLKIMEQSMRETTFARGWFWDSVQFITYTYGVVLFIVFVLVNEKIMKALIERFPQLCSCFKTKDGPRIRPSSTTMTNVDPRDARVIEPLLKK